MTSFLYLSGISKFHNISYTDKIVVSSKVSLRLEVEHLLIYYPVVKVGVSLCR